jgi:hypothetical protein
MEDRVLAIHPAGARGRDPSLDHPSRIDTSTTSFAFRATLPG